MHISGGKGCAVVHHFLPKSAEIRIYDRSGRLAGRQRNAPALSSITLPAGIYVVAVSASGQVYREKVLVR
jgi:hypothetical protein